MQLDINMWYMRFYQTLLNSC